MNSKQKTVLSIVLLAMLTLTIAASLASADPDTTNFSTTSLIKANTLTILGSSTVYPMASEEQTGGATGGMGFDTYWNSLAANTGSAAVQITNFNIQGQGSGTAIPAIVNGTADIGEMSKAPSSGVGSEWSSDATLNDWAVGVDSVVIIVSPDMASWFPSSLTTLQVAELFSSSTPFANNNQTLSGGQAGDAGMYTTWGAFFTANGISTTATSTELGHNINRIVRDPTSGTADCWNTYFGSPNGFSWIHKSGGNADGSQNLGTYTYVQANSDMIAAVDASSGSTDAIGFTSMGYAINDQVNPTHCTIENIQFNTAQKVATIAAGGTLGNSGPTMLHYYGTSGNWGYADAPTGTASYYSWGPATAPTLANVIWAYSGIKGGAATNAYWAYRYLYEDTPAQINANSQLLVTGVWIAMMMADNNTNSGKVVTPGIGSSSIIADNSYIPLDRCDMAGQLPLDANFASYTPKAGQTQTMPDGKVNFADIQFFVANYIGYYTKGVYSPYCDFNADGKINFADIQAFVHVYVQYYQIYNPLYVNQYS